MSLFCSCVKYEGEKKVYPGKEYLVASERGCFRGEYDGWIPYYFVKEKGSAKWETYEYFEGLNMSLAKRNSLTIITCPVTNTA